MEGYGGNDRLRTDGTGARAREVAAEYPRLRLYLLEGPGRGSGHARRAGMEAACDRLLGLGKPDALIASTDADTVVAPDWVAAQFAATDRGARATGGRIALADDGNLPRYLLDWHADLAATAATASSSLTPTTPGQRNTGSSLAPPSR